MAIEKLLFAQRVNSNKRGNLCDTEKALKSMIEYDRINTVHE